MTDTTTIALVDELRRSNRRWKNLALSLLAALCNYILTLPTIQLFRPKEADWINFE
jgi:hypothetical protein